MLNPIPRASKIDSKLLAGISGWFLINLKYHFQPANSYFSIKLKYPKFRIVKSKNRDFISKI